MSVTKGNKEHYILAVDDIPDNLLLVQLALEQEGHHVVLAHNGEAALKQIEQSPPSLILLDVMMPGMDGKTAIRTLKQINPDLKIIAVSGLIDRQEVVAQLNANVNAYLAKPYSNDDLLKTINEIIRRC